MLVRPGRVLAVGALVSVVAVVVASTAGPVATQNLLVRSGSDTGKATRTLERTFGGEPIVIALQGDLTDTLSTPNLLKLIKLEGLVSRLHGVKAVFGPGTFVNATVTKIQQVARQELGTAADKAQAAAAAAEAQARRQGADARTATARGERARLVALGPLRAEYQALLVRLGAIGVPSLDNAAFVHALVFGDGTAPKRRFQWLFKDNQHALILVRLKSGISDSALSGLGRRIRALTRASGLSGVQQVGGAPLLAASVAGDVSDELIRLAPVLAIVMLLVLAVGLRPGRHVPSLLALSVGAASITAAVTVLAGLGLSAATVAALPVVIGLALDFAVQLQSRHWALRRAGKSPDEAARASVAALGAVLGLATAAMCGGFLMLAFSPVPLISRLGLTLAVGVVTSLALVMTCGPALLVIADRAGHVPPSLRLAPLQIPRAAITVGGAALTTFAVAGLALAGSTTIQTDIDKLSRSSAPELRAVQALQRDLGSAGALRIDVSAKDVTSPAVVAWMTTAQARMLQVDPRLTPGPDPADLLTGGGTIPDAATLHRLTRLIPPYFLDAVISHDRHQAELSVGIPLAPVAEQRRIVAGVRRAVGDPPAGVTAVAGGLVASGVTAVDKLHSSREWILLGSLVVVFMLLLLVRRRLDRALIPLVPALVVTGLSAFVIHATGLALLPLGAALEPLVLAVGLEFGLLLEARYQEFRAGGQSRAQARVQAQAAVGGAVAVSAATVAVAFLSLAVARLALLRQFGLLVCVELLACAAVAVLTVPWLAAWADRKESIVLTKEVPA